MSKPSLFYTTPIIPTTAATTSTANTIIIMSRTSSPNTIKSSRVRIRSIIHWSTQNKKAVCRQDKQKRTQWGAIQAGEWPATSLGPRCEWLARGARVRLSDPTMTDAFVLKKKHIHRIAHSVFLTRSS
jgi:hypothetical protein